MPLTSLEDLVTPSVRLGVTGLARAGKTVFITALVRNLVQGGRLPFFSPSAERRLSAAYLEPQPDDDVPRFDYEAHLAALAADPPEWPQSTRHVSQLRVTVEFQSTSFLRRQFGTGKLHIDIVDYPGEWLIDLGLIDTTWQAWSAATLALVRAPHRRAQAGPLLAALDALDPHAPQDEAQARRAAAAYTRFLGEIRAAEPGLSTLGPGRFLMPGDLAGSPLLTFAPLPVVPDLAVARGSLAALMERRFESYKSHVVLPFFRDHFSRLDRQIVLVDALHAVDSGARAVEELTAALEACLKAFRPGRAHWLSLLLGRRIDRVLFAATKADHLHHTSHDRLEAVLGMMTRRAADRAAFAGAEIGVLALAALRATRETEARQDGERLACIAGVPLPGERIGSVVFDGRRETVIFPGDLPADPATALDLAGSFQIARFRPPRIRDSAGGADTVWPHIRLDRALEFLLGDRLA